MLFFFCFFHLLCFKSSLPPAVLRHRPSKFYYYAASRMTNLFLLMIRCNSSCSQSGNGVPDIGIRAESFPCKKLPWLHEHINLGTLANPEGPPQSEKSLPHVNIDQLLVSQVTELEFNYSGLCQPHLGQGLYTYIYEYVCTFWLLLSCCIVNTKHVSVD